MVCALAVLATLMTAFIDFSSPSIQGIIGTILTLPTTASTLGNHAFFLLLAALLTVMGFSTLIPMIMSVSHELAAKFGMTRERASALTSIFGLAASVPYVWWLDTALTPVEDGVTAGIRLMAGTEVYLLFIGPAVVVILMLGTTLLSLKADEIVGHSNFVSGIRLPDLYGYLLLAAAGVGSLLLLAGVVDRLASLFLRSPVTGIDIIALVYWIVPVVLATGLLTASRGWTETS
jgi:SNF family Na+-dependent transporter